MFSPGFCYSPIVPTLIPTYLIYRKPHSLPLLLFLKYIRYFGFNIKYIWYNNNMPRSTASSATRFKSQFSALWYLRLIFYSQNLCIIYIGIPELLLLTAGAFLIYADIRTNFSYILVSDKFRKKLCVENLFVRKISVRKIFCWKACTEKLFASFVRKKLRDYKGCSKRSVNRNWLCGKHIDWINDGFVVWKNYYSVSLCFHLDFLFSFFFWNFTEQ